MQAERSRGRARERLEGTRRTRGRTRVLGACRRGPKPPRSRRENAATARFEVTGRAKTRAQHVPGETRSGAAADRRTGSRECASTARGVAASCRGLDALQVTFAGASRQRGRRSVRDSSSGNGCRPMFSLGVTRRRVTPAQWGKRDFIELSGCAGALHPNLVGRQPRAQWGIQCAVETSPRRSHDVLAFCASSLAREWASGKHGSGSGVECARALADAVAVRPRPSSK